MDDSLVKGSLCGGKEGWVERRDGWKKGMDREREMNDEVRDEGDWMDRMGGEMDNEWEGGERDGGKEGRGLRP